MKISSVSYLTKEGFKNVWTNRLMSLSSIGVLVACMVLIGTAILAYFTIQDKVGQLQDENVIVVSFDDYNAAAFDYDRQPVPGEAVDENGISPGMYTIHNEAEAKALCEIIENLDNVESVEFLTKEQALETVKNSMRLEEGTVDPFEIFEEAGNPMSDGAIVTVENIDLFDDTIKEIEALSGVDYVRTDRQAARTYSKLSAGIGIAGIAIIAILLIIAFVIVSNTIRVTMYNRKLEIGIMKAVGATNSFVRLPFVVEGVIIGIISAIISMGVLYCCYRIVGEAMEGTTHNLVPFMSKIELIAGVFLGIGVIAGVFGSMVMIRKYLKKEGSEFAAI